MTKIFLIRHGEASGAYTEDADPGLSDKGKTQALALRPFFANQSPLKIYSSPLRRASETAKLVAGNTAKIFEEPRMSEIPSNTQELSDRGTWLKKIIVLNFAKFKLTVGIIPLLEPATV